MVKMKITLCKSTKALIHIDYIKAYSVMLLYCLNSSHRNMHVS